MTCIYCYDEYSPEDMVGDYCPICYFFEFEFLELSEY